MNRRGWLWAGLSLLLLLGAACDEDKKNGAGAGDTADVGGGEDLDDPRSDAENPDAENPDADLPDAEEPADVDEACSEGRLRCRSENEIEVCRGGDWQLQEACGEGMICAGTSCARTIACTAGEAAGCFPNGTRRVCNPEGTAYIEEPCPDGLQCLAGECTERICVPGERSCADRENPQVCNAEGTGFDPAEACVEGEICFDGSCLSGCELSEKFPSYIGCKYWSLDLDQHNDPTGDPAPIPHAVVFSNPAGGREAIVRISTEADIVLPEDEVRVPPGGIGVFTFPRLDVDGTGISRHSFYLESNWPVVAYQFNPLDNVNAFSNDASLLLPAEFLGQEYVAMSWPTQPLPEILGVESQFGYVTIVATRPGDTRVRVRPTVDVIGGENVPFLAAGEDHFFSLRQFQVLNLAADDSDLFGLHDLTGSTISASQPIAVFGGHEAAVVGDGCCAEHMEQQLFPVSAWGRRYLAVQSEPRGGSSDIWRVVAALDGTTVETIPPQPGAERFTLQRGEWMEIETGNSFEVVANTPVMVGQYLKSQEDTRDVIGDPAFIMAVPIESFRDSYTVLTPADYTQDWFTVVRKVGEEVRLDGQALDSARFRAFGSGEFEYAWVSVEDGPHTVESDAPFSLTAYGFSAAVSYGYPGGLNLKVDP